MKTPPVMAEWICSECPTTRSAKTIRHWIEAPSGWWIHGYATDDQRWVCGKCAKRLNP